MGGCAGGSCGSSSQEQCSKARGQEVASGTGNGPSHRGRGLIRKDLFGPDKEPGLYHQAVGWRGILNNGQVPPALCLITLMLKECCRGWTEIAAERLERGSSLEGRVKRQQTDWDWEISHGRGYWRK